MLLRRRRCNRKTAQVRGTCPTVVASPLMPRWCLAVHCSSDRKWETRHEEVKRRFPLTHVNNAPQDLAPFQEEYRRRIWGIKISLQTPDVHCNQLKFVVRASLYVLLCMMYRPDIFHAPMSKIFDMHDNCSRPSDIVHVGIDRVPYSNSRMCRGCVEPAPVKVPPASGQLSYIIGEFTCCVKLQ